MGSSGNAGRIRVRHLKRTRHTRLPSALPCGMIADMKRRLSSLVLALLVPIGFGLIAVSLLTGRQLLASATHAASSATGTEQAYAAGEVLVRLRSGVTRQESKRLFSAAGLTVLDRMEEPLDFVRLRVPQGKEQTLIGALRADQRVTYAGPNHLLHIVDTVPNDPYYPSQWGLARIHAPEAWDVTTGTSEFTVAVVDTGVDIDHADIIPKLVGGATFVTGTISPDDDHGHGTHVAGIAAAASNNALGVAGVSWAANIMPIKVLAYNGFGTEWDVAQGVLWATNHGADVINMSLAGEDDVPAMESALDYAHTAGVLSVASAGNCGDPWSWSANGCSTYNPVLYPAAYDSVMAVAATTYSDQRATFSEIQPYVDVAAPGVSIWSTLSGSSYGYKSGTSQSAPFVSGLAALVWSLRPDDTNDEIQAILESSADDVNGTTYPGKDSYLGWGLINAYRAVEMATQPDLQIDKSDGRVEVRAGEFVTYTLRFTNSSAITATNVRITDALPSALEYEGSSPTFIPVGNGQWRLNWGDLLAGEAGVATVSARVRLTVPHGTLLTNTISVGDDGNRGPDPTPANNLAQDIDRAVAPVLAVSPASVLFLSDTVTAPSPATIAISNVGSDTLTWQAAGDADWLGLSPPTGTVASGTPVQVTAFVRGDLVPITGFYTANITVSTDPQTIQGSPQTVSAALSYVEQLSRRFLPRITASNP